MCFSVELQLYAASACSLFCMSVNRSGRVRKRTDGEVTRERIGAGGGGGGGTDVGALALVPPVPAAVVVPGVRVLVLMGLLTVDVLTELTLVSAAVEAGESFWFAVISAAVDELEAVSALLLLAGDDASR